MRHTRLLRGFFVLLLALVVCLAGPAGAQGAVTAEVGSLLTKYYVDPVPADVLAAPDVDEMLTRLGDPHTRYFTPAAFQDFLDSLDLRFSGIGIHINSVPQGIEVVAVIKDSPAAAAGMQSGDVITMAAGQSLAGCSTEEAAQLIRGPAGSTVDLTVQRGDQVLVFSVTRAQINVPTVTGELLAGRIGYIDLESFGSETPAEFARVAGELKDRQADRWIVDLRSNPGGYLGVALDLAGYFAGDQAAVQFKNKNTGFRSARGTDHGFIFDRPAIVLTDRYSASASEILAACVQDYGRALLLGERTYGKGTVQGMYDLTGGGKLKLTIDRFYSPQGKSINETGVSPDWELADTDQQLAAELLLAATPLTGDNTGYVQVATGPETFTVDLALARTERYWPVWAALLATRQPDAFKTGTQTGWQPVDAAAADRRWPLFYPGYRQVARMNDVPPDKQFTVTFSREPDFTTVNAGVELIAADSGSRVPLTFLPLNDRQVKVAPDEPLTAGGAYWLLVHRLVTDVAGRPLNQGALALVTVQG